jgi:hypothetical protein
MTTTKATRDVIDLATRPITNLQCTGGNIDGTAVGNTTPSTGKFTNLFGNDIVVNASGTLDLSASGVTILGTIHAYYAADIAEDYVSDSNYNPGTVVAWGGTAEITAAKEAHSIAGVISTNPSYQMNSLPAVDCEIKLPLTLTGRVPVRVVGPVKKFDVLVLSHLPGVAEASHRAWNTRRSSGMIIGRALADLDSADGVEGLVEAAVQFHIG